MSAKLRTLVRGAYDIQKLRIQMGNRICMNFKAKLGQEPSQPEEELDAEAAKILANLRTHYKKITDGVKIFPRQSSFKGDEVISDYTELCLIAQYVSLEDEENKHFSRLGNVLNEYPIYEKFLSQVRGIGPAMAGVIISEIDIHKAKYVSSLERYIGIDVVMQYPDGDITQEPVRGEGRGRYKHHLVETTYTNKKGEECTKMGITFNPFLKTKLTGVLAPSFLRSRNEKYCKAYADYKNRLENSTGHANWYCTFGKTSMPDVINEIWQNIETSEVIFKRPVGDDPKNLTKGWRELPMPPEAEKKLVDGVELFTIHEGDTVKCIYRKGKTKGHRHNMALRYMLKVFLRDLYVEWKTMEGLPVFETYEVAKLGLVHGEKKAA